MDILSLTAQAWQYTQTHSGAVAAAVRTHLLLSLGAVGIATLFALPIGLWCSRSAVVANLFTGVFSTIRVIPGLAILALAIPALGTGSVPAALTLSLLAFPTILLNTISGFQQIEPELMEAARGLGMSAPVILWKVELPIAAPSILNGVRVALVEVISAAALAAFVGGGGLGKFIVNGLGMYYLPLVIVGALPVAIMAIVIEISFALMSRRMTAYRQA